MSMMRCDRCQKVIDTDDDPDSLYETEDGCICERCRELEADQEYEYTDKEMRAWAQGRQL